MHLARKVATSKERAPRSGGAGTDTLDPKVLFGVLADPTRRDVLERLVHDGPDTATRLAAGFPLTRQAIVRHLQALAVAGLVCAERDGREVRYRATTDRLAELVAELAAAGPKWDQRLERLRAVSADRGRPAAG